MVLFQSPPLHPSPARLGVKLTRGKGRGARASDKSVVLCIFVEKREAVGVLSRKKGVFGSEVLARPAEVRRRARSSSAHQVRM